MSNMATALSKRTLPNVPTSRSFRAPRSPAVVVRAAKKNDLEEAFKAQQELLAERRQKAAEQAAGMTSARYVPKGRGAPVPEQPKSKAVRTPKAEPQLIIEEEEEESGADSGNPLGFLGKLFGKK